MKINIKNILVVFLAVVAIFLIVRLPTFAQTSTKKFAVTVKIHGIGTGGDNVSPSGNGTMNPLHTQRTATITLRDAANNLAATKTGAITYNAGLGQFQGTIDMGAIQSGVYTALIKTDQTLRRAFPGIISVSAGQTVTLPAISLVTGDTNNDNALSIMDYNMLLDCFSDLSQPRNCSDTAKKIATDITDDGNVNQFDYNLFLRELSVQGGDNEQPSPFPTISLLPTVATTFVPTISLAGTGGPSGEKMPVGDLPGWKQIFTEDFTTAVPLGGFPTNAYYKTKFRLYGDNVPDTAGQNGAPSRYYPSKVISVANGVLTKHVHTENGISMGAAILPLMPTSKGQIYGKYTVRFRADSLKGYKTAWLLWPDSGGNLLNGEIDFPEGDLASTIHAYMHRINASSGGDQDTFSPGVTYTAWHTTSTEWSAGRVVFILDGQVIGTSTTRVPSNPMHWVLQTESCLPTCPAATTAGDVQIDWVVAYSKI